MGIVQSLKDSPRRTAIAFAGGMAGALLLFNNLQALEFTPPVTYPAGIHPLYVTSADFNGDGVPDLASVQSGNWPGGSPSTVALFRGNGDGTFVATGTLPAGPNGWGIAAGDLNGDGKTDLATVNRAVGYPAGNVTWYPGNGDGTFQPPRQLAAGRQPCSFALADIDDDADLDIVVGNHGDYGAGSNLEILFGDGMGNFAELMPRIPLEGAGINDVQIVDLNRDGLLDIVTANWWRSTVSVLLGVGGGDFGPPSDFAIGYRCDSVAVADFNEDGKLDLVAADQEYSLSLLSGRGDGTFLPRQRLSTGIWSQEIVALDMDKDGHCDVVFADRLGHAATVLSGNGNGTFRAPLRFASAAFPYGLKVADLNRDGYEDIAMAHQSDGTPANVMSVLLQIPAFCACLTDPSVIFCDDFSQPNPLANYTIENPPNPGAGQSPRAIAIDNESLVSDYLYGFGVAKVTYRTAFNFRETQLEGDVRFETPGDPRANGGIQWIAGDSSSGLQIQFSLQLDENLAYLFIDQPGGTVPPYWAAGLQIDRDVTYRLRLEILAPSTINCYVDNQLVLSATHDLSLFPIQMNPGVAGNSYPSPRIRYDNLVVRALNQAPVAKCKNVTVAAGEDCTAPASIDDGSFDPDPGDTITLTQSPPGPYALGDTLATLTVTDSHGASSQCSATVTVVDTTPPSVSCPTGTSVAADANCQASVPDIAALVTASDNCDASLALSQSPAAGMLVGLGTHTITVTATDDAGNTATCTTTFTVIDTTPPVVSPITAPIDPVVVNTSVAVSAVFTDNCGPQTAVWTWGDGTTSDGVVDASTKSVSGEHVYAVAGVHTVTLTVTDQAGLWGEQSFRYVVVFDPDGGFVTGGGWINSPVGAYTPDPILTGKATFGFVAKYRKGATVPSGNAEFQFKAGNLNFKSTSYQWLVIAGARAQFKGWGSINGQGNYAFMLTAIDGQVSGGGGLDRFRIKIWQEATSTIVYDNQRDTADNAALGDATVLQGGSIVIHKP